MIELINFSIKRRFLNSATIFLNIVLCIIVGGAFFADEILNFINPKMFEDKQIYLNLDPLISETLLSMENTNIQFIVDESDPKQLIKENPDALVLTFENGYQVYSTYQLDTLTKVSIEALLSNVHQTLALSEMMSEDYLAQLNANVTINNQVSNESIDMDGDKQNLVFMVITSIYFTMLSFSTSVANEVVYEKSTRQLELILTSVNAKSHFYSKMIVGWLAIIIQCCSVVAYIAFWMLVRNGIDQGVGLLKLIGKMNLFKIEAMTFSALLGSIQLEFSFIVKLLFIFFFLMIGILFIQMILVILSSFIVSIEEAGNIQAPFYLILLGVYYFALSINSPYQMSEGLGFYCSFIPFLSMLFMPCRLLIQDVAWIELCLSASFSIIAMLFVLQKGPSVYQKGVLDYSNKGFIQIVQKSLVDEERGTYERKTIKDWIRNYWH